VGQRVRAGNARRVLPGARRSTEAGMSGPGARAERALGGCRRQAPASRGSSLVSSHCSPTLQPVECLSPHFTSM
jgi:hypothetical protein